MKEESRVEGDGQCGLWVFSGMSADLYYVRSVGGDVHSVPALQAAFPAA